MYPHLDTVSYDVIISLISLFIFPSFIYPIINTFLLNTKGPADKPNEYTNLALSDLLHLTTTLDISDLSCPSSQPYDLRSLAMMSPSHAKLSTTTSTPRAANVAGEQLPLLQTSSSRGDATLIDIANQHEQLVEPEPVIGREFWTMLSLVYPVVWVI